MPSAGASSSSHATAGMGEMASAGDVATSVRTNAAPFACASTMRAPGPGLLQQWRERLPAEGVGLDLAFLHKREVRAVVFCGLDGLFEGDGGRVRHARKRQ